MALRIEVNISGLNISVDQTCFAKLTKGIAQIQSHVDSAGLRKIVLRKIILQRGSMLGQKIDVKSDTFFFGLDFIAMEDIIKTKAKAVEDLARARHDRNKLKEKEMLMKEREIDFQILYKDIAGMSDAQLQFHETLCNKIKEKLELY